MATAGTKGAEGAKGAGGTAGEKGGRPAGSAPAGGKGEGRGSRLARYAVVGGVLLAVLAGCGGATAGILASEGYLPGDSMREVWSTPAGSRAREYGNGSWLSGDTVVRSHAESVTGHDARSGRERWTFTPPGRARVCAVSTAAEDGIALVVLGMYDPTADPTADPAPTDAPTDPAPTGSDSAGTGSAPTGSGAGCSTVTALSLADGRALWRSGRVPEDTTLQAEHDVVAVGGGLAVVRDEDGAWPYARPGEPGVLRADRALRALDLRTGAPKWSARLPAGCVPYGVAAGRNQVLALVVCDDDISLTALDPANGRVRWTTPLDERQKVMPTQHDPVLVSADPAVVAVQSLDDSGRPTFLSFGDDGRPQGRIASGPANGTLRSPVDEPALTRIAHGRLYTVAEIDYDDVISAFDLRSGQRLWRAELDDREDVIGLRVADGRVTALVDVYGSQGEDGLVVLDADTGDERDLRTFPDSVGGSAGEVKALHGFEGRLIAVRWGDGYFPPLTAYEER
ncbi:PQQ-binding-like beta-propeller repeat protein [Streptomyces filamentosus]|uniref:outer membrane protein assembly factor BamB family protein n=1 Tax=Streptomyces filamentosus TaxID=67294 RepID=UPI0033E5F41C